jgi:hypothetical protein
LVGVGEEIGVGLEVGICHVNGVQIRLRGKDTLVGVRRNLSRLLSRFSQVSGSDLRFGRERSIPIF